MQCFILAGGFATRLWPITERRAKPLLPLAGRPLLSYAVESIPANIPVTVSTNAVFAVDMKAWAKTVRDKKIDILIEDAGHEDEKLGALGAVAKWIGEKKITDDVLLIAGDNYVGADMKRFLACARGNPLVAVHDIGDTALAGQFGTVIVQPDPADATRSVVTSFEEKPPVPKSTLVSTGWWWLPASSLPALTEFAEKHPDNVGGVFEEFLKRNITVDCFSFTETWKDIGSFDAYIGLQKQLVGEKALVDPSSRVDKESKLLGSNDIGPAVAIEKSTLTDCIVFGHSNIIDCVLQRCIIDAGCTLEGIDLTDQMLRAGTVLKRK